MKSEMPALVNPLSPTRFVQTLISLKRSGVSLENVRILLKGVFENYKGEIICQFPPPDSEIDSNTTVELEVGIQSMVDMLPHSLFYDSKKKHQAFDKIELKARKLFSCFDSIITKIKGTLEYVLLVYHSVFWEHSFFKEFLRAFDFPDEGWTSKELFLWTYLLPRFHQWAGTKQGTEEVLSKFLETEINIQENGRCENNLPVELQSLLGKKSSNLGQNWSLGNCYSECGSHFKVRIGPIPASQVIDFLPYGVMRKKLDRILEYCVPGQLHWSIAVELNPKERKFTLGKNTENCILGYSAYVAN